VMAYPEPTAKEYCGILCVLFRDARKRLWKKWTKR